ncbi:MAG: hypothetical protein ACRDID_16835 [Ktedonobacterales bacterium]
MAVRQPVTRRYLSDAHYNADAAQMAAAGWHVVSLQCESSGAIVASYALNPVAAPSQAFRRARPWYRSALGAASIMGFAVILGALVVAAILGVQVANNPVFNTPPQVMVPGVDATNQAFASSLDAAATANAALATETPLPTRVSGPRLGAPLSDFDAAFGPQQSQGMWQATLQGHKVQINIAVSQLGDSADASVRVVIIDIIGADTTHAWTTTQDTALVASFLPGDAARVRDIPGWNALGPDHIFTSAQLANSLTASVFQDTNNQTLAPGTFDWQCSTSRQVCEVAVGTNS